MSARSLWNKAALPGIVLLAVVARLYGIATESLWLDEATSLMLARMSLSELITWTAQDIHPPLFYILLHYWIALGESEAVLRGLSTLAGAINVWAVYALGRALFDRRTGLYAALLLALNPFHIWYSQETRMYAWLAAWMSLSLLLALRAWRGNGWLTWVGYVATTAAALYTHYYAVFVILIENLYLAYAFLRREIDRRTLWAWIASQVAVFLLFLPWLPTFLFPITTGGGGWVTLGYGRPSVAMLQHTVVLYMIGQARAMVPSLLRRAGYVLFAGACAGALLLRGAHVRDEQPSGAFGSAREATAFCLGYLALPIGLAWLESQVFKPMFSSRYMLPFLTPFVLLVAWGLRKVPSRLIQALILLGLVGVMAVGIVAQVRMPDKPDWRTWSAKIVAEAQPGDLILFIPGWHAKPFDYYARGAVPYYEEVPVPVEHDLTLPSVEGAIKGYKRVWLVWETDHYTDPDGMVYGYLREHLRPISEARMPLLGRIFLFENTMNP